MANSQAGTGQAPGPVLETARLILRPPRLSDLEPWAAFAADEEVQRHLGGVQARSAVWRMLCTMAGSWTLEGFAMFSVMEKASGAWVGRVGPWRPDGWPGTEVGWGIQRDRWGRGYAVEAAEAAIDWVFDDLGWTEVIHCIDPANVNSQAVARKLGSSLLRQALLPAPINDTIDVWGQSREAWRARREVRSSPARG